MHAYFAPADAVAPAAAGAGEAADCSGQWTAALPTGAAAGCVRPRGIKGDDAVVRAVEAVPAGPGKAGLQSSEWAASRCKTDDYIAPKMPRGAAAGPGD